MLLRDYRHDDLARVHAINESGYPGVATESPDALAHIAEQSLIRVVAEIDSVIAGFCLVLTPGADYDSLNYLWFHDRYDDFIYLDRIAIAPEFQRRGVGTAIYAEVERLAAERRPTATVFALEVNIEPRNDQSLAFHARLGFTEVGQQDTDYGARVSLMTKPLP